MKIWEMIDELDVTVQEILKKVPRNEYKIREQIDSASDSVEANFIEGYYSGSTKEYLRFLSYGRRSLGELRGRIRRLVPKEHLNEELFNKFENQATLTMYFYDRPIDSLQKKSSK